jgi:tetratricopeptide (TPR) repeat protein
MIARARRRNVPIVICTLPVNIRDVPPAFSPAPTEDAGYFRARAALDRGRPREAAREFAAYSSSHSREPWGYYWLGKALDLEGADARARRAYLSAIDRDDPGDRCSPRRNAIIRGLAGEDGVAVADVEPAFARAVPDGLTDSRLFKDDVHWYDEYYPLVSLTIVKAIADPDRTASRPLLAPPGDWVRWWTPRIERALSHPAMDASRRARYADEIFLTAVAQVFRVDAPGFEECGCSYFRMAERMSPGIMKRYLSSPAAVIARVDADPGLAYVQTRLKSEWPRVLMHAGEACRMMNRPGEARAFLDESLRSAPKDAYARLFRGILERSLGNEAAAAADLRQAALSKVPGVAAWAAAER